MRKSKKFLSALLCIMMLVTMMPAMAFANEGADGGSVMPLINNPEPAERDKVFLSKSLSRAQDGTYTVTMEAYATGEMIVETMAAPTDFVVVLDQSGSMKDYIEIGNGITDLDKLDKELGQQAGFYYGHLSGLALGIFPVDDYYELRYDAEKGVWRYNAMFSDWPEIGSNQYTISDIQIRKINAAKVAVKNFINSVAAEKATSGNDHRIAVVGFNDNSVVLNPLVAADNADLKNVIKNFKTNGATHVDYGVKEAETIFQNEKNADAAAYAKRGHVVIVVSDGSPTSTNGFEDDVANSAISAAMDLKGNLKAKIYTVGLNLDKNDKNYSKTEKFMNYLSSNYPKAVSMTNPGEKASDKYYKLATSSVALNDLFEQISVEGVQTDVTLDETAVLWDAIHGGMFNLRPTV